LKFYVSRSARLTAQSTSTKDRRHGEKTAEAERQKRKGKKTSIEEIKSPFSTFRSLQKAEAKMWRRKKRGSMKKIGRSAFCFPLKAEAEGRKQKSGNVKSLL